MRGNGLLSGSVPLLENMFASLFDQPGRVGLGLLLAVAGAVAAGIATWRRSLVLAGMTREAEKRLSIVSGRLAGMCLVAALGCMVWVWVDVGRQRYGHLDGILFVLSLVLAGVALHRLDRPRARTFRRLLARGWKGALVVAGLSGVVSSFRLDHWLLSYVSDEFSFFDVARAVTRGMEWSPFSLAGVYGAHPMLDSAYQAAVMRLLGVNVIGWRVSEVLVLAASAALVFLLALLLYGRVAAWVAGTVIGCSHYLVALTRIAYNNTHCVFWGTLAMLAVALAWKGRRLVHFFAAGVALGMCLYTFMAAVLVWPIASVVLIPLLRRMESRRATCSALVATLAFTVVVVPGFLTTPVEKYWRVAEENSRREDALSAPWEVFGSSLVRSSLVWLVNRQWLHHHVGGPLLDPLSGVLLLAGAGVASAGLRSPRERFGLVWFGSGITLLAATSYRPEPMLTRLMLVMPAASLLCGNGARVLARSLGCLVRLPPPKIGRLLIVPAVLLALPALNLHQLWVVTPSKVAQEDESLVLRVLQEHPEREVVEVGADASSAFSELVNAYPWLIPRFRYMSRDSLERSRWLQGRGLPPIYVVAGRDDKIADHLRDWLPSSFRWSRVFDPSQQNWMFVAKPCGGAVAP